jgi:hypothetical protein
VDVARRAGRRPDVIRKTYAHFMPGATGRIAKRLEMRNAKRRKASTSRRFPQSRLRDLNPGPPLYESVPAFFSVCIQMRQAAIFSREISLLTAQQPYQDASE